MSEAKLQRTIVRFKSKIDSKEYYEAHQTLRTITNRYVNSKQYKEAADLLYQGASILAKNGEYASAGDLLLYMIEVYQEAGIKCANNGENKEYKLKLIEVVRLLPNSDLVLVDLSKQSIAWSLNTTCSKFGDNELHHVFGEKFLKSLDDLPSSTTEEERQKVFALAELHLILGLHISLPLYVDFLYRWLNNSSDDKGLFLGRAVINYLYLKNVKFAEDAVSRFLSKLNSDGVKHEVIEQDGDKIYFYDQPNQKLLNFLQFLVLTVQKEAAGAKFLKLYDHYSLLLDKYEIKNHVEYLGRVYFGLQIGNSQGGQNVLADLMGSFFK